MTVLFKLALALAALSCAACAPVTGSKPPAGLSWHVISALNGFYDDVDDPTNRPPLLTEPPEGVVRAVDVNADGVNDWIIDWPHGAQFCGTGGCRITVYLTHGQNLVRLFDRQALEPLDISMVDGEPRFEGRFHHLACNDARRECRLAWGLDATTRTLVPRPSANGDTYSSQADEGPIEGAWAGED